ncbi:NifX-associated nitrogen fixation protein [Magnetofaba australis]|uniref:Putative nitrogen fixation protein n=1 Tax=Magnetofaba australis IT-1 TaxID=1434232 RepID=A0A1Y2K6P6_9PROT|nr:NifX-associated nitrogen fixation protein [Magnetofaba australis]OSM04022.1 putative nitrogen fixation protein [Magnetofaba australis IT-1]
MSDAAVDDPIYESAFVQEMVKQMRALDTYGVQDKLNPQDLLKPFIMTKAQRKEIPVVGDPDPITLSRVGAYYNAIAMLIEQECGLMARPVVNISHEGFGSVLIIVGALVAVDRNVRDVHRFSFESLSKMKDDADKLLNVALGRIGQFKEVAEL